MRRLTPLQHFWSLRRLDLDGNPVAELSRVAAWRGSSGGSCWRGTGGARVWVTQLRRLLAPEATGTFMAEPTGGIGEQRRHLRRKRLLCGVEVPVLRHRIGLVMMQALPLGLWRELGCTHLAIVTHYVGHGTNIDAHLASAERYFEAVRD